MSEITRKEYSQKDVQPAVVYAKKDNESHITNALMMDSENRLKVSPAGATVPKEFDSFDLSYTSGKLTTVVYKLGGVTVATLTLTYTDGILTNATRT